MTLALTFQSQRALWLLLALPVLLIIYVIAERRRSKYAARFTNVDLLASVVARSPNVRRHVPPLVYLLAIATLVLAVARPTITGNVAQQQATVMLVIDVSGSMIATDVQPSRIAAAQSAAQTFVNQVPGSLRVGLVAFSTEARLLAPPSADHSLVKQGIDSLTALGATAMGDAIELAVQSTAVGPSGRVESKHPPTTVLLLSDGKNTVGRDPLAAADDANRAGVHIYTVALGTPDGIASIPDNNGVVQDIPVPPDPDTLQAVADRTGGKFFSAPDANQLSTVYSNLGSRLGQVKKQHEITNQFAAVALGLVLVGALLGLAWFSRFP